MGDHGMTTTGDHGGDSDDELSATLFAYSSKFHFARPVNQSIKTTVDQVDFVPTISLLLGTPIPYSNLGKLIPELFESIGLDSHLKLSFLKVNVDQVMTYLDRYRLQGGVLPTNLYERLRKKFEAFRSDAAGPLSPEGLSRVVREGLQLLSECKAMCQSVWVEFDLNLMGAGITLFFLHLSLVLLLVFTPRNRLLTGILNNAMLLSLLLSLLGGLALGCVLLALDLIPSNSGAEVVLGFSTASSIMVFGFTLLWRLRKSLLDMATLSLPDAKTTTHILVVFVVFAALFSNSFVVEEATLLNFCLTTLLVTYVWELRHRTPVISSKPTIVAVMLLVGFIRASNAYFRCREEQSSYCLATDFHKPIGTLPRDLKSYRNWRFFSTIMGVVLVVAAPHRWLKSTGNLNGISLAVVAAR
jgi:phosphatidylinositol glycan class O